MFHVEHYYLTVEIEDRRADCSMWNISTMLGRGPMGFVPRGTNFDHNLIRFSKGCSTWNVHPRRLF
jgi:hypothetical protein